VITWAAQLSDLSKGKSVDWSDTWADEDLADVQRASLANFDARGVGLTRESQGTDSVNP